MDICGFVLLHCMFCMLRGQNLAPLNCGISFETLIFLENSHFIEYKVCYYYCDVHIGCVWRMVPLEVYSSLLVLLVLCMLLYLLVCVLLHVYLEKDLCVVFDFGTIYCQEW